MGVSFIDWCWGPQERPIPKREEFRASFQDRWQYAMEDAVQKNLSSRRPRDYRTIVKEIENIGNHVYFQTVMRDDNFPYKDMTFEDVKTKLGQHVFASAQSARDVVTVRSRDGRVFIGAYECQSVEMEFSGQLLLILSKL